MPHRIYAITRDLDCSRYYHLPRVKTHGLHGCDISGIGFRNCEIAAATRIGAEGHGLELALKGFQITRTFCTSLSLGSGDSALRLVTDFAVQRQIYGASVINLPHSRAILANAYLSQLIGECSAIVAARGLHLYPRQYASWSSIAKVQVTHLIDHAGQQLAGILGARYYMREQHHEGMFQKILRDSAIVSIFDGSSTVCLDSLATMLPTMVRARRQNKEHTDLHALYDLQRPLPSLPFQELDLFGRGRDAVSESLSQLIEMLSHVQTNTALSSERLKTLRSLADALEADFMALEETILADPPRPGARNSAAQFSYAECFCALHSATACLGIWLFNHHHLGPFFAQGGWLGAALVRRGEPNFHSSSLTLESIEVLMPRLIQQYERAEMFSLLPWPLAHQGLAESIPDFDSNISESEYEPIPA